MASNLHVRALISPVEMGLAEELQAVLWSENETNIIPSHFLLALAHNGGLVLGAFDDTELVGLVIGFLGTEGKSSDRPAMARLKYSSHTMDIHPEYQIEQIGLRLKYLERETLLKNEVRLATWKFDPLRSQQADLYIRRLGAVCSDYIRDYYGGIGSGNIVNDHSDRFQVKWWLTTRRVQSRVDQLRPPLDLANFLAAGAKKVYSTHLNAEGILQPEENEPEMDGSIILIEIPFDIDTIWNLNPDLALQWRLVSRNVFELAFTQGYIVTDFVILKGEQIPRSYYVLSHGEGRLG